MADLRVLNGGVGPEKTPPPMDLVFLSRTRERRVEATACHDPRAAHEHCRGMDEVAVQHVAKDVADADEGVAHGLWTPRREGAEPSGDRHYAFDVQPFVRAAVEASQVAWRTH